MELPKIDVSGLPVLETATGLFGSLSHSAAASDDRIIILMVWFYDIMPNALG